MRQALLVTSVVVVLSGILTLLSPVVADRCKAKGGTVVEVPGKLPLCVRK